MRHVKQKFFQALSDLISKLKIENASSKHFQENTSKHGTDSTRSFFPKVVSMSHGKTEEHVFARRSGGGDDTKKSRFTADHAELWKPKIALNIKFVRKSKHKSSLILVAEKDQKTDQFLANHLKLKQQFKRKQIFQRRRRMSIAFKMEWSEEYIHIFIRGLKGKEK